MNEWMYMVIYITQ